MTLWNYSALAAMPETVLGMPVDIRDHDDRPGWMWRVPHLEAI